MACLNQHQPLRPESAKRAVYLCPHPHEFRGLGRFKIQSAHACGSLQTPICVENHATTQRREPRLIFEEYRHYTRAPPLNEKNDKKNEDAANAIDSPKTI
jgi:hypothetical protein